MKDAPRRKGQPPESGPRVSPKHSVVKRRYLKPRVEPAGSVFSRTKAGPLGTKDGMTTGSSLM